MVCLKNTLYILKKISFLAFAFLSVRFLSWTSRLTEKGERHMERWKGERVKRWKNGYACRWTSRASWASITRKPSKPRITSKPRTTSKPRITNKPRITSKPRPASKSRKPTPQAYHAKCLLAWQPTSPHFVRFSARNLTQRVPFLPTNRLPCRKKSILAEVGFAAKRGLAANVAKWILFQNNHLLHLFLGHLQQKVVRFGAKQSVIWR